MQNNSKSLSKTTPRQSKHDLTRGFVPYAHLEVRRVLAGDVLFDNLATNSGIDLIGPDASCHVANANHSEIVPNCRETHSQLDPITDCDISNDGSCDEPTNSPPPLVTPDNLNPVDEDTTVGTGEPSGGFTSSNYWHSGSEATAQLERTGFYWGGLFVEALPFSALLRPVMATQAISQSPIVMETFRTGGLLNPGGFQETTTSQWSQLGKRQGLSTISQKVLSSELDNLQVLSLNSGSGSDIGTAHPKLTIERPSHIYFCSAIDAQGASPTSNSTVEKRVVTSGLIDHHQAFVLVNVPAQGENQIHPAFDNNAIDSVTDENRATVEIHTEKSDMTARQLDFVLAGWDSTVDIPSQLEFTLVQNVQLSEQLVAWNDERSNAWLVQPTWFDFSRERRQAGDQSTENNWGVLVATAAIASTLGMRPRNQPDHDRLGRPAEFVSVDNRLDSNERRSSGIRRFASYWAGLVKRIMYATN